MERRRFITLLGRAAAWPLVCGSNEGERVVNGGRYELQPDAAVTVSSLVPAARARRSTP
jgi:hypothetical protein